MPKFELMNGTEAQVPQEEVDEFITQQLIPNPDRRHSKLLSQEETLRYWKGTSSINELKKIAKYILVYEENLSFTVHLFDISEKHPGQSKEFNMPMLIKLREIYDRLIKNHRTPEELAGDVHEMERICLENGADPL